MIIMTLGREDGAVTGVGALGRESRASSIRCVGREVTSFTQGSGGLSDVIPGQSSLVKPHARGPASNKTTSVGLKRKCPNSLFRIILIFKLLPSEFHKI
jgi:hypothetical protein